MNDIKKKIFEICKPYDHDQYDHLDLNRLAVYAIWYLNENSIAITIENITVALYLMFPIKFSLIGYNEYPDITRANRALLQLRPKYRNWATGNVQKGYTLTEKGRIELEKVKQMLNDPQIISKKLKEDKSRSRPLYTEMERIVNSSIYQKYLRKEDISKLEISEFLRAMPYTPSNVLNKYLKKLKSEAENSGHPKNDDIVEFLNLIKKKVLELFKNNN